MARQGIWPSDRLRGPDRDPDEYASQATIIANAGCQAKPGENEEYQPLGVFGMIEGEETTLVRDRLHDRHRVERLIASGLLTVIPGVEARPRFPPDPGLPRRVEAL